MEALIPLILQYALQYGVPAAISIINAIKKPEATLDDLAAALQVAQTPYGLTPNMALINSAGVVDLGAIVGTTAAPTPPAGFTVDQVAVRVDVSGITRTVCNTAGNCWFIPDFSKVVVAPGAGGAAWTIGTKQFWIPTSVLA